MLAAEITAVPLLSLYFEQMYWSAVRERALFQSIIKQLRKEVSLAINILTEHLRNIIQPS